MLARCTFRQHLIYDMIYVSGARCQNVEHILFSLIIIIDVIAHGFTVTA